MKRLLTVIILTLALSLVFTGIVYAQDGDMANDAAAGAAVSTLLLPLVTAATAVERLTEMIFDWYENIILNLGKWPFGFSQYIKWARQELEKCQKALEDSKLQAQVGETAADVTNRLKQAEADLLKAQDRLYEYLESPLYMSIKRKYSMLISLILGLVLAFIAQIQMFSLLGISMPGSLFYADIFITGLIIGTGSAPVHSLIGIIQNTKDAVDSARALWKGQATANVQEYVRALQQAQTASTSGIQPMAAAMLGTPTDQPPAIPAASPEVNSIEMDRMVQRLLRK